jgi:glutaredoxin
MKATESQKAIVTLYSKPGCHLCEEAKASILSAGCNHEFVLLEINIESDDSLKELYQFDIPVILINGIKVFKHRVDPQLFKRKLRRFLPFWKRL